ncbi:hypothetical protein HU200_057222 [Digitaria exilis]|uniref:Fe2OG dioxygenase domain-containing protein n=1 Tax=Digitaria exilis TaxID=1010633 RepID=A0A835E577_9POAL|nr:hypothetical protein HU200_057222 [Digitaria exilis]
METPMLHTAEQLPPATVSLPIIDMSDGCDELRRAILDAGRELGFFQVVNHGVPEQLMLDMEVLAVEFFEMPEADKATYYSDDISKANRLCSGATYETGGERYWHDYLHLAYNFPVDDHVKDWPDMPQRLRRIMEEYVVKTRRVGMEILRLVCEGIGLRPDYFEGAISGGDMVLQMNHYPRRRDLTVAVGQPPHCDRSLITVLLPGPIPGLEVTYNGGWIKVKRIPGAFVINFGSQLEVVTNGMLKSIEHREFVDGDNPPRYRSLTFAEFKRAFPFPFLFPHNVGKLGPSLNLTTNDLQKAQKEI